ncbi:MAG: carbohydrate binding family 9 domain-containing protein, partial [Acidobacteria bacterium]|nr:carbohydrate binding family 9 domain-containing protein [Acidobacteriota bacterium]
MPRPCSLARALAAAAALSILPGLPAFAQPRPDAAPQKRASATRVPRGRIAVDGRLAEAEWQTAAPAENFVQQQPREGAPVTPEHRSEVRFLYDDEFLYIGATFHEDEPSKLVVNELKRDFNARAGDLFVVVLDTFLDHLNAYNFQTNPRCAIRDSQSYDDGRTINANWDGVWTCRSSADRAAWYVEEAIPFKQLRFPRKDDQEWGLQLFRLIRHSNEQTLWSPTPRNFNQFKTSFAGVLDGISGVKPGRNIRVKPFATGEARHVPGRTTTSADGGLDVKVGLGTNLVLDGTWRTDFSQVETDAQQINLTRFSLFFPEKREFFLENQGAFQIGPPASNASNLVPFFSRTIGLSDAGTPIPIVGGARLTGKVGRTSLAVLTMRTEEETRAAGAALPAAAYSVVRVGREFLTNSTAGVFVLDKDRGTASNRLVGADLRFYPTRQWNIDGMVMHSETTGVGGGDAWRAGAQYDSGLVQYGVNLTSLGATFRDELGFVPRQGVDILSANLMRRVRPKAWAAHVREIRPQVGFVRYTRDTLNAATGRAIGVETALVTPSVTVELSDASTADYTFTGDEELLTAPFRPQGMPAGKAIAPGRYRFASHALSYEANNAKRLAPGGAYRFGDFYDGTRRGVTASARLRVNENLAATASMTRDVIGLADGTSFDT